MPMKSMTASTVLSATSATTLLLLLLTSTHHTSHAFSPAPNSAARSMKQQTVVVSADSASFVRRRGATADRLTRILVPEVIENASKQTFATATLPTTTTTTTTTKPSSIPLYQLALAGAMATVIGDAAMHPIDCIKTLQQSDEGMGLSFIGASEALWDQYGGVAGFYRGLTTYLVTDAGAGAIKFGVYEAMKVWSMEVFGENNNNDDNDSTQKQQFLQSASLYIAAGIAFAASSTILVPGEFLKQQLQMGHYASLGDAVHHIYATSGIDGFLNGYQGVCARDIPYTMMELGLYDTIKTGIVASNKSKAKKSLDTSQEIMAAAITGGLAGFITTPLDTIKTKLMVDASLYHDFGSCFATTLHDHGWEALFAGAAARVAWLVPFSAIYLPLFDAMKRKLANVQQQQQE